MSAAADGLCVCARAQEKESARARASERERARARARERKKACLKASVLSLKGSVACLPCLEGWRYKVLRAGAMELS